MVTKNMAYWKAKFKNSPIKQDTGGGGADAAASGGGAWGEVGKMVLGKVIDKATEGKPEQKVINPTSGGFSTMRFGS